MDGYRCFVFVWQYDGLQVSKNFPQEMLYLAKGDSLQLFVHSWTLSHEVFKAWCGASEQLDQPEPLEFLNNASNDSFFLCVKIRQSLVYYA